MNQYNPLTEPDREEWLETSEFDRIDAVRYYHENSGDYDFED